MYNTDMEKTETKLKKEGWKIEEFQPKGEKYPWSLKISKKIDTKGLHTDSVTEKIRQSGGTYVITAYLDVNKKLDIKTREERIKSAMRWELIKNYSLLSKYKWLNELQNIVGIVKPILPKKKVHKAVSKNSNEVALKEEKEAKISHSGDKIKINDKQTISSKTMEKTAPNQAKKAPSASAKAKVKTGKQSKETTKSASVKSKIVSTDAKKVVSTKKQPATKKTSDTPKPKTVKKTNSQTSKKTVNKKTSTPKSTAKQKKVTTEKKGTK